MTRSLGIWVELSQERTYRNLIDFFCIAIIREKLLDLLSAKVVTRREP